ncbi:MAG: pyridoxal-phosphate dependent enzyme, partial [Streptomycetaceae bacterium]|nr:pyridoxal-phosphate dependent enzyme [Streptomycetaceae bacterium]
VRQHGTEYAHALEASRAHAQGTGAILAHSYDNRLVAAGAGTLLCEVAGQLPGLDTVVVAVGGGGLFAGTAAAADHLGVRTVAAEPANSRALNAALRAGEVVDVPVDSVAGDSLGAHRVSADALAWAQAGDVRSVLADDAAIVAARRLLWHDHRIVVEHGAATALAALTSGAYRPVEGEKLCVVLCGANTDPSDLADGAL